MTAQLADTMRYVGPDAVEILPSDATEAEWLALRNAGIGASEVAAIDGQSRWQSPYGLWALKTGLVEPEPRTSIQQHGIDLEQPIADRFADRHSEYLVRRCGLVRNIARPWEQATPDRELILVTDGSHAGLLEIKTARYSMRDEWGQAGTDEIPAMYFLQTQHQMSVTGSPYVWVPVLIDNDDYREFLIRRDEDVIDYLRARVHTFWHDNVLGGVAPPVDGHEATTAALRAIPSRDAVELDGYAAALCSHYWMAKKELAKWEGVATETANELRSLLNGAAIGTVDGQQVVSNKWQAGKTGFDLERFTADHPDLAAAYAKRGAPFPVIHVAKL